MPWIYSCKKYEVLMTFLFILTAIKGHDVSEVNSRGRHCGNLSIVEKHSNGSVAAADYHMHCVNCFFPQNCIDNTSCLLGSHGAMCEKCLSGHHAMDSQGYYRVGNMCVPCPVIPWTAVSFGVYVLLFCIATFYNGFTQTVATKMKLLSHFLQLLVLTFHIKIQWPRLLIQTVAIFNFADFNSNIAAPACLVPNWPTISPHYLEWGTSGLVLLLTFLLGMFMDRSLKIVLTREKMLANKLKVAVRRAAIRRFVLLVLIVMYTPVAVSAFHTYLCSDTVPVELVLDHTKDIFLLDNDVSCQTFVFQTFHFFATLFLVVYIVCFPILLIFFTLRQKKWNFLDSDQLLYGAAYESYTNRYCFWEAFPLIRKLVCIVITDTYPISSFVQSVTMLSLSGFYLLMILLFRPYRKCFWKFQLLNVHVGFEILSNLCLGFIQGLAVMAVYGMYVSDLIYVAMVTICVVIGFWIILMFAIPCESRIEPVAKENDLQKVSDEEVVVEKPARLKHGKKGTGWKFCGKSKVEPDPEYLLELEERIKRLNF